MDSPLLHHPQFCLSTLKKAEVFIGFCPHRPSGWWLEKVTGSDLNSECLSQELRFSLQMKLVQHGAFVSDWAINKIRTGQCLLPQMQLLLHQWRHLTNRFALSLKDYAKTLFILSEKHGVVGAEDKAQLIQKLLRFLSCFHFWQGRSELSLIFTDTALYLIPL